MDFGRLTTPQRVSAVALLIVIVAAFLPWVSFFGISRIGVEGDGVLTLVLAVAGAVVLALTTGLVGSRRTPGRASQITLVVLAVVTALVAIVDMNGAAAIGLYLTLLGGITWAVGAIWQLGQAKQTSTPATDGTSDQA